ncbi:MAG: hypothetical protein AB8G18_03225 [Gammaproteobacteria bacterium]
MPWNRAETCNKVTYFIASRWAAQPERPPAEQANRLGCSYAYIDPTSAVLAAALEHHPFRADASVTCSAI